MAEFWQAFAGIGTLFTTPVGAGLKELLEEFLPFFDLLYAWAEALITRDFSSPLLQERLVFPWGEIEKAVVIYLVFTFVTAILEDRRPGSAGSRFVELLCAVFAVAVNAFILRAIEQSGGGILRALLSTMRGGLILLLLAGCVLFFIKKIKSGKTSLTTLVADTLLDLVEKALTLAVLFAAAALITLILSVIGADLAIDPEEKIQTILLATILLVGLAVLQFIASKIFNLAHPK